MLRRIQVPKTVDSGFDFKRSENFSADTDKMDAVVAAFKVGQIASSFDLLLK